MEVNNTLTAPSNSYTFPSKYQGETGWLCPRCGRINAPWKSCCDCYNQFNITCNDTIHDDWWKKYVTCDDTFKIHPNDTVYTTANDVIVGGSDYPGPGQIWSNILKSVSNIKEIY